jgi:hypothetical protein
MTDLIAGALGGLITAAVHLVVIGHTTVGIIIGIAAALGAWAWVTK